ncbi:MAG TPA: PadR family transcriptional regulator [Phototrophicaceae bacterium]|nr:PadR family transcriptional regulator [Phototrophicaceae bacterium]
MARKFKRSPLALAVLALLHEEPMHPYKMQRLIKERGKDQVIKVEQRASLYQTIDQLLRADLITFWETARAEGFPERTVYKLTDKGRQTAIVWLREMISMPAQEYPEFPAAISLLPLLTPEDAVQQLEQREARLRQQMAAQDQEIAAYASDLPRLFLLESEYMRAVWEAELNWVRSLIADLRSGAITWSHEWLKPFAAPKDE